MICPVLSCLNEWTLQQAHILLTNRTSEGCTERIKCPKCGTEFEVRKPDMDACSDDRIYTC
jgi:hypothetical protein